MVFLVEFEVFAFLSYFGHSGYFCCRLLHHCRLTAVLFVGFIELLAVFISACCSFGFIHYQLFMSGGFIGNSQSPHFIHN